MKLHLTNEYDGTRRLTLCGQSLYPCLTMTPAQERHLFGPDAAPHDAAALYVCERCESARADRKERK